MSQIRAKLKNCDLTDQSIKAVRPSILEEGGYFFKAVFITPQAQAPAPTSVPNT